MTARHFLNRKPVAEGVLLRYWVEADLKNNVRGYSRLVSYSVWTETDAGRVQIHRFPVGRKNPADIALYLANMMRDDLLKGIE